MHRLSQSPRLRLLATLGAVALIACAIAIPVSITVNNARAQANLSPKNTFQQQKSQDAKLRALLGGDGLLGVVGPPEEAIKPIADKLNKKLKIQFLDTPLDRVVDYLQRESGITFLINRGATGGLEKEPVSLEAEELTIKEALDWSCVATHTDWDVIKGVIVVSTPNAIKARRLETRIYDVRSLLVQMPHFYGGPEFDINSALSNTSSGGSTGGAAVSATTLFGDEESSADQATREEIIEQVVNLIQDTIGKQEEWAAYGGTLSSLREMNGNLIIKTSPRHHAAIEQLLKQMHESKARMVYVEARYMQVPTKTLDDLITKNGGDHIFSAKAADELLKIVGDPNVKSYGAVRMTSHNGQRIFLTASNLNSFLSDVEPVTGGSGFDPTLSVLETGAKIDCETIIGYEGKTISLTFQSDLITGASMRQTAIPYGGKPSTVGVKGGSVTVGKESTTTKLPGGDLVVNPAEHSGAAMLEEPDHDLVRYRSSVTVPDGGCVILTGVSSMLKSVNLKEGEVVLILRARAQSKAE